MGYKAIVAGASGLVGGELVKVLLAAPEYNSVVLLIRKKLPLTHSKLLQVITDFDRLNEHRDVITGHAIFSCLGSTRKKTPSLAQYRKIDHDYPVQLAEIGAANGMKQFHLVSAIGANASSSNFYNKMKGETEDSIRQTAIPAIFIYQPSFLLGDRGESRPVEKAAGMVSKLINPVLQGKLKKYRSIPATTVAAAMYKQSLKPAAGVVTYPSDKIGELV